MSACLCLGLPFSSLIFQFIYTVCGWSSLPLLCNILPTCYSFPTADEIPDHLSFGTVMANTAMDFLLCALWFWGA